MYNKKELEQIFADDFGSPYFPVLANLYLNDGDFYRAKQVCKIGISHDQNNAVGQMILAKIAMIEEKPTVAERWLKRIVTNDVGNFSALRMLIRIEFILKRKHKTVRKYINMILRFLPSDIEANKWLKDASKKNPSIKKIANQKTISTKTIQSISAKTDYEITSSMATFTMLGVLKKQKSYQQALLVLDALEKKNTDIPRIKKEREILFSLIKKKSSNK